jgi:hypothetical protein
MPSASSSLARLPWRVIVLPVATLGLLACSGGPGADGAREGSKPVESTPPDAGPTQPEAGQPPKGHAPIPAGDSGSPPAATDAGSEPGMSDGSTSGVSGSTIAAIATANIGLGACSTNSEGGTAFETSCDGNDGEPEYWCADFAQWVWQEAGADTTGLDAAAGSFYVYGQNNGTLHVTPLLGDAVVFNYGGDGYADHVAIVIEVNADGTIETVSGDWNGTGSTEAEFSSTSSVVLNSPAYPGVVETAPDIMGMTISGFVSPVPASGGSGPAPTPTCIVSDTGAGGTCIDTTTCSSEGGTSTPGYCPGPDDIQCCTGAP